MDCHVALMHGICTLSNCGRDDPGRATHVAIRCGSRRAKPKLGMLMGYFAIPSEDHRI